MSEQNLGDRKPVGWFTMNGKHIPIFEGETKADAIKRSITKKSPKFKSKHITKTADKKTGEIKARPKNAPNNKSNAENKESKPVKSTVTEKKVDKKPEQSDKSSSKVKNKEISTQEKRQKEMAEAKIKANKLNAEKKYEESLKMGNKVGVQNGHLTFKGKEVPKLNTSDVLAEKQKNRKGSLNDFIDKDGNLSAERLEAHRQIIEEYFGDHKPYKPGEEKKALQVVVGQVAKVLYLLRILLKYIHQMIIL